MQKKYSHAVYVGFTVVSSEADGDGLTRQELLDGMSKRLLALALMHEDEAHEAFDVYDVYQLQPEPVPNLTADSLEMLLKTDQPMTCPVCGARTEFAPLDGPVEIHVCMNVGCKRIFRAMDDDEGE